MTRKDRDDSGDEDRRYGSDTPVRSCMQLTRPGAEASRPQMIPGFSASAALREGALVLQERGFSLAVTTAKGGRLQPRLALASMLQALCYSLTLRFWAT